MRSRADVITQREHTGRLARAGLLLALAVTMGMAEALWLPVLPLPGLRLGLANVAVVVAFAALGPAEAAFISVGRVLVVGAATGTLLGPVGALSLAAALGSWLAMFLLWRCGDIFSPVGWSVAGAAASVMAQIAVACVLSSSLAPVFLVPVTLGLSLPSGFAVGILAGALLSRVSRLSVNLVG